MRRRQSGLSNVLDFVLEDISKRVDFPASLVQIVGLAPAETVEAPRESSSLCIGNESEDVLLGKPANKEQLDIAQQLSRRDCVLVQGPPGTGKTHTIANLLGHLLAAGKSVLVTAHTRRPCVYFVTTLLEPFSRSASVSCKTIGKAKTSCDSR